ncbi:hypothetical protein E1218_12200 [Kribbella turkmenica]|uniref:NPCBM-associated, NEW3 domain of alpha-galactosidase n=1 Tax=Kribbella turkmenica TaxID=2530375 RepID=A0A4R4X8J4_9ACTN|nr:NEW3 domain-containing protein [Kribbella turkmenica]TDD26813.1 hypothetical protein E1218_12200 [Kribbella turkmenica]
MQNFRHVPSRHRVRPLLAWLLSLCLLVGLVPAHQAAAGTAAVFSAPLREISKPNLTVSDEPVATIEGATHRMRFYRATWSGGQTYLRDIAVRRGNEWLQVTQPDRWFDEQWIVFTGAGGSPFDYYSSMTPNWVGFDTLHRINARTVEMRSSAPGSYGLRVRWSVEDVNPEAAWTLTAQRADHFVVGYQSTDITTPAGVDEVLCGTRQHARVIYGSESLGAMELMTPACLTERKIGGQPVTLGVYTPAEAMTFAHERELGPDGQPFGMSLRNEQAGVQPVVYAPQVGRLSALAAGEERQFSFGVYARTGSVYDAYVDLARNEYDYTDYRRNVYDTSLTETTHNLIDLVMQEPPKDDSETFQPSASGWWNRAKGFVDTENDRAVRTAVSGVLLSASQLTGDQELYDKRARPMVEYQLSRNGHGWTPIKDNPIYGDRTRWKLGAVPGDASTLVPLSQQTGGANAGIQELAMRSIAERPNRDNRTPISTPLAAYRLTGNKAYLAEARAEANRYIQNEIDPAYTTNVPENHFQFNYSKGWIELLELYEETRERRWLDAAYTEAKRYVTQSMVRPVPGGTVTVPDGPWIDNQTDNWLGDGATWSYPRKDVPTEEVPAWMVSTNGMTFEQLTTYKVAAGRENPGGGLVLNPIWAPFLLRLAGHTNDQMMADVAHNLTVGRFTNYPGYYNREFSAINMKPDFPLQGPPGVSSIYYHHIPAQLGLAMDYLFTEQWHRSGGRIDFPAAFETDYVYFKYHVYGHQPGTFYGEGGVRPFLPRGIVHVSDPQLNWVTGYGNDSLYLSLTNENDRAAQAVVRFDPTISGIRPHRAYQVETIADNGQRQTATMRGAALPVAVSAKGITAVIVRGVETPKSAAPVTTVADSGPSSYRFDDNSPIGTARAMALVRPDRTGYDAYVQADTEAPATLHWSTDGGATWHDEEDRIYPNEWTIRTDDIDKSFTYRISAADKQTDTATLQLPPSVTGQCLDESAVCGLIRPSSPDTTPGDTVQVQSEVLNATSATIGAPEVQLEVPMGWSVTEVGSQPTQIPAGRSAVWTFAVTPPNDAPVSTVNIGGRVRWTTEGTSHEAVLSAGRLGVLNPLKLSSVSAAPTELSEPGDTTTVTATVLNTGSVERTGTLRVTPPPGWTITPDNSTYKVAGRTEKAYTFTLRSPETAQRDQAYRIAARINDEPEATTSVRIKGTDIIVDNQDFRPNYTETGQWLTSSLKGWDGGPTRYSGEGQLGGTVTWRPDIRTAGWYEVAAWYPSNADTTTSADYLVHHADGDTAAVVNQQDSPQTWRSLGTFRFDAGSDGFVRLTVDDAAFHRVSGVRFRPIDVTPTLSNVTAPGIVAPGQSTTVSAQLTASAAAPAVGCATVGVPPGWEVEPAEVTVNLAAGTSRTLSFTVRAPEDAKTGGLYEIRLSAAGATAQLVVPIGAPDGSAEIVVDDGQAGYSEQGVWSASSLRGYLGSGTRFTSGQTEAVATWKPELPAAGRYQVSVWYPATTSSTTAATYVIHTVGGTEMLTVDQTAGAGQWRVLGSYDLDPANAAVQLSSLNTGHHRADAVRFEPLVQATDPPGC